MTLEKYNAHPHCTKCGYGKGMSEQIQLRYCNDSQNYGTICYKKTEEEHLHHTCPLCNYQWLTETNKDGKK